MTVMKNDLECDLGSQVLCTQPPVFLRAAEEKRPRSLFQGSFSRLLILQCRSKVDPEVDLTFDRELNHSRFECTIRQRCSGRSRET